MARKMTAKQIRYFGTKAQRAALKRARSGKKGASTVAKRKSTRRKPAAKKKSTKRAPRGGAIAGLPTSIVSNGLAAGLGIVASNYVIDNVPKVPEQLKTGGGRIAAKAGFGLAAEFVGKALKIKTQYRRPFVVGGLAAAGADIAVNVLDKIQPNRNAGVSGLGRSDDLSVLRGRLAQYG